MHGRQAAECCSSPAARPRGACRPRAGGDRVPVPTPVSQPAGITVGPDGALWFTEENGHKIGRITTAGAHHRIPDPDRSQRPLRRSPRVPTARCGSPSSGEPAEDRPGHHRGRVHASSCSRRAAVPTGSRRGPTAPSGSRRTEPTRSAGSPRRGHHGVPAAGRVPARRHHARARRAALVHRVRGRQDRRDHDGGQHHRVRPSARERTPRASRPRPTAMWFTEFGTNQIGRIPTVGHSDHPFRPHRRRARPGSRSDPTVRCGSRRRGPTRSAG